LKYFKHFISIIKLFQIVFIISIGASRVRKDWMEEREKEDVTYESVVQPSSQDVDLLAESILPLINLIMKLEFDKLLPSDDEVRSFLKDNEQDEGINWPTTIPQEYGTRKLVVPEDDSLAEDIIAVTTVHDHDNECQQFATNYEANNATVDCPMNMDLASDETVQSLMKYTASLGTSALKADSSINDDDIDPIMGSFGVPLLGDGNPSWAINKILRKTRDTYKNKVQGFFGGFHLVLEAHKKRGDMFGPTHLRDFFSAWRTTDKQLDWVMHPGDPNQVDAELIMYHLAMYTAAIRSLVKAKREREPGRVLDNVNVNPCDVVDHMVARAKEHPIALCILLELRFAEVIFMLHESEKKSKSELFIAAIRFLLPLFTTNHATKYVSLVSDFLVEWFCSSDAEKIIYAKAIFTRKTKNGSNIFTDRYFEWMVKDLRMWLGKFTSIHHHTLIQEVAATLNERKKMKTEGATNKKKGDHVKNLPIDRSFCEVLAFCLDTNLWGSGPIKITKAGPYSKRHGGRMASIPEVDAPFQSLSGKPLNQEVLFCLSTGIERGKKYFDTFLKNGDWFDPSRPETNGGRSVSLGKIDPEVVDIKFDVMEKEVKRVSLRDYKQIDALYTSAELKVELTYLNALLESRNCPQVVRNRNQYPSWSKPAYIFCIIEARLKLLEINPDFISERQQAFRESYRSQRADIDRQFKERIDSELENNFFSLHEAKARDTYKNQSYNFESIPELVRQDDNVEADTNATGLDDEDQLDQHILNSPAASVGAGTNYGDMDVSFSPF
jgi:hypothetical protein